MPPKTVKTIRDLLYWHFGVLSSRSTGNNGHRPEMADERFEKLKSGKIAWDDAIRKYILKHMKPDQCSYCTSTGQLSLSHLIHPSQGGPSIPDNLVVACKSCIESKAALGVYEWFELRGQFQMPPIVEGKYLRLLYNINEAGGTLDSPRPNLDKLCNGCAIGTVCEETKMTIYCLESILVPNKA